MAKTIRCKYRCEAITARKHWDTKNDKLLRTAEFVPVHEGSEENQKFFEATPSGKLEIGQFTEDAFEVGKEYYVDVTLA